MKLKRSFATRTEQSHSSDNNLDRIISVYIQKGFGSMTKNDFEVWIFNYLLANDSQVIGKSNYAISNYLKIPETKVKRLRYEANLKYSDTSNSEASYRKMFIELLTKARIKKEKQRVLFSIEDLSFRKFIESKLKDAGRFSDSSFNSEIVSIDIDDLAFLVDKFATDEQKEAFLNKIEQIDKIKLGDSETSMSLFKNLFETGIQLTIENKLELSPSLIGIKTIDLGISNVLENLINKFK